MYICFFLSSLLSTAVWAIFLANLNFNFTALFPVFNLSLFFYMSGVWIMVPLMMKTFPTFHKNSFAGILQKVLTDTRYMLAMLLILVIFFCIPLIFYKQDTANSARILVGVILVCSCLFWGTMLPCLFQIVKIMQDCISNNLASTNHEFYVQKTKKTKKIIAIMVLSLIGNSTIYLLVMCWGKALNMCLISFSFMLTILLLPKIHTSISMFPPRKPNSSQSKGQHYKTEKPKWMLAKSILNRKITVLPTAIPSKTVQ